jgi:RNA polymerase sigma-70 factor (ECF subfamily)
MRAGAPRPGPGLAHDAGDDEAAGGATLEQAMLGWQVAAALERLTPEHRQMIRMAQFRGLTMREISEHTGLPLGTVKSRTWYALRSLRLVLEEMGVVPS